MDASFKKFFTYVLNEYCEETCTSQDEIFELIQEASDNEQLADLFIEEGFLKWRPEDFICLAEGPNAEEQTFLDFEEQCSEQYWESICEKTELELDAVLEYL